MQEHTGDPKLYHEKPNTEEVKSKTGEIGGEERVCFNCRHLLWGVALGVGLRCTEPRNHDKSSGEMPPMVPSSRHTCDWFEFRNQQGKDLLPTTG